MTSASLLRAIAAPVPSIERDALARLPVAVIIVDRDCQVRLMNASATELLDCLGGEGSDLSRLLATCGVTGAIAIGEAPSSVSLLRMADGRTVRALSAAMPDGGRTIALLEVEARESEAAETDPVTLAANRKGLEAAIERMLAASEPFLVAAIDIGRFRHVNDTLGHAVGDALLRRVADRLRSVAGEEDFVARLDGGTFVLLQRGSSDLGVAAALAEGTVDLLSRAYAVEGQMINITVCVGVVLAPRDGTAADTLLHHADLAVGEAKARGASVRFFEPAFAERIERRRQMELDLRRAMALKQLELFYQPQIDLRTGLLAGFEALLRWRRDDGAYVSPAEFIPIAEETGLIVAIGEWALRTACREAAGWNRDVTVAVNLSPVQFRSDALARSVVSALANSGLVPDRLELEITEGALLDDTEAVVNTLKGLRSLGVRVSMDDFGTGYSSLGYLRKFPFDKIKIDQSFVRELEHDGEAQAIVRTIAALGMGLGMKITAEGVETEAQLAEIRRHGCDFVQGYLTGRPMHQDDVSTLLASFTDDRPAQDPSERDREDG